jgi:hypothetical protein
VVDVVDTVVGTTGIGAGEKPEDRIRRLASHGLAVHRVSHVEGANGWRGQGLGEK